MWTHCRARRREERSCSLKITLIFCSLVCLFFWMNPLCYNIELLFFITFSQHFGSMKPLPALAVRLVWNWIWWRNDGERYRNRQREKGGVYTEIEVNTDRGITAGVSSLMLTDADFTHRCCVCVFVLSSFVHRDCLSIRNPPLSLPSGPRFWPYESSRPRVACE